MSKCHHCHEEHQFKNLLQKAIVAAALGISLMAGSMAGAFPAINSTNGFWFWFGAGIITLGVLCYSGGHFFKGAWKNGIHANMDTLIALGTGTAWLYSMIILFAPDYFPALAQHAYFDAACMILAFINAGSALESKARGKTSEAIERLLNLQPKTARVVRDDKEIDIDIADIKAGDVIRVRPGESVAVDGEVIDGHTHIDESMLTGEPMPVKKIVGSKITGGTLNKTGSVMYRATAVGEDMALSRIAALVEQAQTSKPPIAKLADKISSIFVPVVVLIAIISAVIWSIYGPPPALAYSVVISMAVVLIACPCALGLATPIAVIAGVGRAAEHGILVRNGEALQLAGKLNAIILDKTGTLTEGKPTVTTLLTTDEISETELLTLCASVEKNSEHPLAQAIVNAANEQNLPLPSCENFSAITGKGVNAIVNGKHILIGNKTLMDDNAISTNDFSQQVKILSEKSQSPMYVSVNKKLAGLIAVSDPIKPHVKQAIKQLKKMGLDIWMITGDQQSTADAVAKEINIKHVMADVLPEQKAHKVKELQKQGYTVAMVGDGINDAPALAQADVGLAIATGTDVAIESADISLLGGHIDGVVSAIKISRATSRIIKQNLFGAFAYNSLGIPIAAGILYPTFGILLNPMFAAAAMAASSLTVVLNANRLKHLKIS